MPTNIEWCKNSDGTRGETWNPTVGCRKVSEGCWNCYAEKMAARLKAMGNDYYRGVVDGRRWNGKVMLMPNRLDKPLHWRKPRRVFVDSMSDLFHEDVPSSFIFGVLRTIRECEQHTFIILTKRAKRMSEWFNHYYCNTIPYPNIWLGVSVEDQKTADERVPLLLQTPAAVRFVSVEPMLEYIDLDDYLDCPIVGWQSESGPYDSPIYQLDAPKLDWVICGSESGTSARPFDIDWARSLKDQCENFEIPFFLKQMPVNGKLVKMPALDGQVWAQYPGGIR